MTMMQAVGGVRPGRGGRKTRASVWDVLQWAFGRERASIDFEDHLGDGPPAVGMEYILMDRARLGCEVDGGGRTPVHPDADVVAAALAVLPEAFGGRRMALWIADLARSGQVLDWMEGARPRIEPVEWRQCKHGRVAKVRSAGRVAWVSRGRRRELEVFFCPVRHVTTEDEIRAARRHYGEWWLALLALQISLREGFGLTGFELTSDMPPATPWQCNG